MTKMISDMKKRYLPIHYSNTFSSLVIGRVHKPARLYPYPVCQYLAAALICIMALLPVSVQAEASAVAGNTTKEAVKNSENSDKVAVPSAADTGRVSTAPYEGLAERPVSASEWVVKAEQWELARDGESILALPALNAVVNNWLKEKDKMIEVQYPGGEEGEFWVHQFIDWLVALGIPSDRMVTVRGSGADDIIRLNLIK